jgi:hypothetical protein
MCDFSLLSWWRWDLNSPCDITQHRAIILYRRFGMIHQSRNVGIKITTLCCVTAQKSKDLLLIHSFACLDFVIGEQASKSVPFWPMQKEYVRIHNPFLRLGNHEAEWVTPIDRVIKWVRRLLREPPQFNKSNEPWVWGGSWFTLISPLLTITWQR